VGWVGIPDSKIIWRWLTLEIYAMKEKEGNELEGIKGWILNLSSKF